MEFISYEQALKVIGENTCEPTSKLLPLEESFKKILNEDLRADRDFPPFDRVTMDGIAIKFNAFKSGQRIYDITKIAAAGAPQAVLDDGASCVEVMTGAMLPINTDTVIRYEDLDIEDEIAKINVEEVIPDQNVHFRGLDQKEGDVIVGKGKRISSAEINIGASIGKTHLEVIEPPDAVIISTGDELVDISKTPKPYQIRRSNSHGIQAILENWGVKAELLHLPDEEKTIRNLLTDVLARYKMVVLTGGVSKGKFDYLPKVMDELGVERLFYKIRQRPGKPFWFGKSQQGCIVFALPGNPVSSFVCAQVYIRHWLAESLGFHQKRFTARLSEDVTFEPELTYFLECSSHLNDNGMLIATPEYGNGSGDFSNLVNADGFIQLPPNKSLFKKNDLFAYYPYRDDF